MWLEKNGFSGVIMITVTFHWKYIILAFPLSGNVLFLLDNA